MPQRPAYPTRASAAPNCAGTGRGAGLKIVALLQVLIKVKGAAGDSNGDAGTSGRVWDAPDIVKPRARDPRILPPQPGLSTHGRECAHFDLDMQVSYAADAFFVPSQVGTQSPPGTRGAHSRALRQLALPFR